MYRIMFIIWLVVVGAVTVIAVGCPPEFRNKCICGIQQYDYREQYVVNCTDNGFRDTDILKSLPPETEVLIFTGNNIPEVPWNIFGTLDMLKNLRVVDMSNNEIKEIKGKSYHHVQNVERLILNHNQLIISDDLDINHHHPRVLSNFVNLLELHLTNAFADNTDAALADDLHDIFVNSNLTRLQKLYLGLNEILNFRDHKVFCDLPNLRDLYLGDNFLTGMNFNVSCLKHLRFLDLEENQFETLTKHELSVLDQINNQPGRDTPLVVDFRGNPFSCECSLFDFYSWLKTTNVTVRLKETMKCTTPKAFSGKMLLKLKISRCKSFTRVPGEPTQGQKATMGFLIFVSVFLFLLLLFLIYKSRHNLHTKLSPLVEAISKKVQYTTLKNRDNLEDI